MSFSLLLYFLSVLSLETSVCSILKFCPVFWGHNEYKGQFTRSVFKDTIFVGFENGSCEHIKNDLPSNESVILKKRMEIEHAYFHPTLSLKDERHRQILHDRFGAKLKILCKF